MSQISKRLPLLEPWPGPWALWAEKFCRANYWRVRTYLGDYEDAVAECAYIYVECRRLYGDKVDSPAWFMSLYKQMVITWFNDYSNYDSKQRDLISKEMYLPSLSVGVDLEKMLVHKTKKSSNEVRKVVELLLNTPQEIISTMKVDVGSAKNFLQKLCHTAGISVRDAQKVQDELKKALITKF